MMQDTKDLDPTLLAVSDTFMEQLEELLQLEETKRLTAADDPAFPALARRVEDAARLLLERASLQTTVSTETHDDAVEAGTSATIDDIPERQSPVQILARWRDADRELSTLEPGSARRREVELLADALRRAYQRAYEERNA